MQGLPPFIQHRFRAFCPPATRTSQGVPIPEGRTGKATHAGRNEGEKARAEEGVRKRPLPTSLAGAQTGSRAYTTISVAQFSCALSSALSLLSSSSLLPLGWFLPLHSNPNSSPPAPEEVGTAGSFVGVSGLGAMYSKSQVPGPQTVGGWRQECSPFLDTPRPCQETLLQERGRHWERCFWPGTWQGCTALSLAA